MSENQIKKQMVDDFWAQNSDLLEYRDPRREYRTRNAEIAEIISKIRRESKNTVAALAITNAKTP